MNLAFASLLVFFLFIPGLLFTRFYYSGEFSKEYIRSSVIQIISLSFIPSLSLHALGVISTDYLFSKGLISEKIDFSFLEILIDPDNGKVENLVLNLRFYLNSILKYNASLWIFSAFLGWFSKFIIRTLKIDCKIKILRFQNEWHYILSGELMRFPKIYKNLDKEARKQKVDLVYVDTLCEIDGKGYLYRGILIDYLLSPDSKLNLLYLAEAEKKIHESIEFKPIAGRYFVLRYDWVKNINLTYYYNKQDQSIKESRTYQLGLVIGLMSLIIPPMLIVYFLMIGSYWILTGISVLYALFITYLVAQVNKSQKNKLNNGEK